MRFALENCNNCNNCNATLCLHEKKCAEIIKIFCETFVNRNHFILPLHCQSEDENRRARHAKKSF